MDAQLNELPKQIFILLPLLYVLYHVLTLRRKNIQQKQQRQQHKNLLWQFIQLSIHQLVDA